jgi:hypothetical protein
VRSEGGPGKGLKVGKKAKNGLRNRVYESAWLCKLAEHRNPWIDMRVSKSLQEILGA